MRSRRRLRTWRRESPAPCSSLGLRLPVEVLQRIGDDLVDHRLYRRPVLRRVVHEHARYRIGQRGRAADDRFDAGGFLAFPLRADDQVEARLGIVRLADLGELVGARVIHCVDPEAVAEVGHLDHHRLFIEREEAEAVDNILVRTGDEILARVDVVAQHPDLAARRDRQNAVQPAGLGRLRDGGAAVDLVDHWPAPGYRPCGPPPWRIRDAW